MCQDFNFENRGNLFTKEDSDYYYKVSPTVKSQNLESYWRISREKDVRFFLLHCCFVRSLRLHVFHLLIQSIYSLATFI